MSQQFLFQDPGEGIREAEVIRVLVAEGDSVREGQDVLVVETDKAAFELSSPHSGTVQEVVVSEGDRIEVGDVLLRYADEGADQERAEEPGRKRERTAEEGEPEAGEEAPEVAEQEREEAAAERAPKAEEEREEGAATERAPEAAERGNGRAPAPGAAGSGAARPRGRQGRKVVMATPATRRLARELDVRLEDVEPSGEDGRVLARDVRERAEAPREERAGAREQGRRARDEAERRAPAQPELPDFSRFGEVERVPLRSVRRRTAERMAESWRQVARVTHHDLADITELERLRARLAPAVEETGAKLTLTAMMMRAVSAVLQEQPRFNASYDAAKRELVLKRYVNIGVAVDTERGLLVPVLRNVPGKSLGALAAELAQIAEAARAGELAHAQLVGGTFTVTNVGPLGGTAITPIVNYPEVAILGMARARLEPVVSGTLDAHKTSVRLLLPLSLSFDHRVIDGAEAARFVSRIVQIVADPDRFLVSA